MEKIIQNDITKKTVLGVTGEDFFLTILKGLTIGKDKKYPGNVVFKRKGFVVMCYHKKHNFLYVSDSCVWSVYIDHFYFREKDVCFFLKEMFLKHLNWKVHTAKHIPHYNDLISSFKWKKRIPTKKPIKKTLTKEAFIKSHLENLDVINDTVYPNSIIYQNNEGIVYFYYYDKTNTLYVSAEGIFYILGKYHFKMSYEERTKFLKSFFSKRLKRKISNVYLEFLLGFKHINWYNKGYNYVKNCLFPW
jgi:hypothetical protein